MQRKQVIFVADSLDNAHKFQQVLSSLDVDVAAGSSAQFKKLLGRHPACDLVVYEARGGASEDVAGIEALLLEELRGLMAEDFDLGLIGIPEDELDALLHDADDRASIDDGTADTIPEAPAEPVTQYGDLWILGRHRVLCGDCTRPEDRALLLDGNKPEILLTDPPYCSGGSKESQKSTGSIGTERKNGKAPKIANDILSTRGYQNLIRGALTDIPCLYAYIFTDWRMWVYLFDLVEAAGFGVKSEIVWDKGTPGMGVGWRSQHELILFGAKAATHFDGHKGYGNVLSISRSGNELHPTQKPVELLEKLVDNTDFATGVYDPFGGSGTTLAACEAYGQPSYIMELTPAFTDVIVKRYIRITGKTTVRCVRQGRELPREEIAAIFEPDEEGGEQE